MHQVFRSAGVRAASLSLTLAVGLASCEKKTPEPTTGAIEATILPAGQVTAVTATSASGQAFVVTPDAATGSFSFAQLPPGSYTLTVATTLAYAVPAPVPVSVAAGATTRPRFNTLMRDRKIRGTFRWVQDGITYTATNLYGEVSDELLSLDGYVKVGNAGHEVAIVVPSPSRLTTQPFKGVGTYELGTQDYPFGMYTYTTPTEMWRYYTIAGSARTGTVTVSRYDPAAFTVAGTFEFDAPAFYNPTGIAATAKITQGNFDLTY